MKRIALVLALFVAFAAPAFSDTTPPEKRQAILELMEITGALDVGQQISTNLMAQLAPAFPEVPENVWAELAEALNPAEAAQLVVPIYDRHFTLEELQGVIEFYKSDLGKRVVQKLPLITQESMAVGQQWGEQKARQLLEELAERGFQPQKI